MPVLEVQGLDEVPGGGERGFLRGKGEGEAVSGGGGLGRILEKVEVSGGGREAGSQWGNSQAGFQGGRGSGVGGSRVEGARWELFFFFCTEMVFLEFETLGP